MITFSNIYQLYNTSVVMIDFSLVKMKILKHLGMGGQNGFSGYGVATIPSYFSTTFRKNVVFP